MGNVRVPCRYGSGAYSSFIEHHTDKPYEIPQDATKATILGTHQTENISGTL